MTTIRDDFRALKGQPEADVYTAATLRAAMMAGAVVQFQYDDKERVVEVHAIGTSPKDSTLLMRGVQTAGAASRPLPGWTLFTLNKIKLLTLTFGESQAPRIGYTTNDAGMVKILSEIVPDAQA